VPGRGAWQGCLAGVPGRGAFSLKSLVLY
jgi:hypothetical protein